MGGTLLASVSQMKSATWGGVEKRQDLLAWQDFVVWYFAGKQRNAAQEDKRREAPSGGSHAGLIPIHYVLHRCGIALPKIRNGGIHQMPRHLAVWQVQQPVAARSWERRALAQPRLAPVLIDDRLQRMVGGDPWLPDAADRTCLVASEAQPWLGPRHLAQQAVHRARLHCATVVP